MADPRTAKPIDVDLSVASWIAEVIDADRADASRSVAPPAVAVRRETLLHRVVEAERRQP